MSKGLGMILPYIMIVFVGLMDVSQIEQREILTALGIGLMLSLWMIAITKSEGTVLMKLGMVLSIVIFIVAIGLGILTEVRVLMDLTPILILLTCLECAGYYLVNKNKPRLSMTYQYSYKNKRRRYF